MITTIINTHGPRDFTKKKISFCSLLLNFRLSTNFPVKKSCTKPKLNLIKIELSLTGSEVEAVKREINECLFCYIEMIFDSHEKELKGSSKK